LGRKSQVPTWAQPPRTGGKGQGADPVLYHRANVSSNCGGEKSALYRTQTMERVGPRAEGARKEDGCTMIMEEKGGDRLRLGKGRGNQLTCSERDTEYDKKRPPFESGRKHQWEKGEKKISSEKSATRRQGGVPGEGGSGTVRERGGEVRCQPRRSELVEKKTMNVDQWGGPRQRQNGREGPISGDYRRGGCRWPSRPPHPSGQMGGEGKMIVRKVTNRGKRIKSWEGPVFLEPAANPEKKEKGKKGRRRKVGKKKGTREEKGENQNTEWQNQPERR